MATIVSGGRRAASMSGLMLGLALLPVAALAYTQDEQQACTGDAFRLCSSEIPDVDRVTACMVRNKSQLSPECRVFFRPGPEPEEMRPPRQHRSV